MRIREQVETSTPNSTSLGNGPSLLTADSPLPKPPVVVCVLVVPEGTELTLNALRDVVSREVFQQGTAPAPKAGMSSPPTDSWLTHSAAAEYLGVSPSTLYRYAEHRAIESRKLWGRLQYRVSSLDKFQEQHIRRAHRSLTEGGILSTAPSSGK